MPFSAERIWSKRVALITGGARGIGRAVALDLAQAGWDIALCYRTSESDAVSAGTEIERHGARALAVRCDVSDPDAVRSFIDEVSARLCACHAPIGPSTAPETDANFHPASEHSTSRRRLSRLTIDACPPPRPYRPPQLSSSRRPSSPRGGLAPRADAR